MLKLKSFVNLGAGPKKGQIFKKLKRLAMAKTANPEIDIFQRLEAAEKAFEKEKSADLLAACGSYFVDRSKTALKEWPKSYTLIKTK